MVIDIVTHAEVARQAQVARDRASGIARTTWASDTSAWDAAAEAVDAGLTPQEILARWDAAIEAAPVLADDADQVEDLMAQILGPSYRPEGG